MLDNISLNDKSNAKDDSSSAYSLSKEPSKVIIGKGAKITGEITDAEDIQVDGNADVTLNANSLVVGSTGDMKGTITSNSIDVWGKLEGKINVIETLTVRESGIVSGSIEYQNMDVKLGGKIIGKIKVSEKIKKLSTYK